MPAPHQQSDAPMHPASTDDDSFTHQWRAYFEHNAGRMWGWTVAERVEQLLMELQVGREWLHGRTILDAGCGSGELSEAIAALGARVIALDAADVVYEAERRRRTPLLRFVRGDVSAAGLRSEAFDAVISMGVLMFTPKPSACFAEICRLVKPGGRLYICVDRHADHFGRRYLRDPIVDAARRVISRLPRRAQRFPVHAWAHVVRAFHTLVRRGDRAPFDDYLFAAYNEMTPRWRRRFSVQELAGWFHANGFAAPVLTHWDNPHAVGLLAIKERQSATPGVHFGAAPKAW
jgi:SAM-dependent methyltransferase